MAVNEKSFGVDDKERGIGYKKDMGVQVVIDWLVS